MDRKARLILVCSTALLLVVGFGTRLSALPNRLELGVKGGLNIGGCSGFENFLDPADWGYPLPTMSKGSRLGVVVGGFVSCSITDKVSLQPEILYSQAGCKRDFDIEVGTIVGKLSSTSAVNYFEIPVLLRYAFLGTQASSPSLCAGVSVGVRTSAHFESEASRVGFVTGYRESVDIDDYVKSTNLSLVLGGGYALRWPEVSLVLEARYIFGLSNVMEKTGRVEVEEGTYFMLDEAKPRTISFAVGLAFR